MGMTLWVIIIMLCVLLLLYVGVTRVVAETGLASLDLPYNSANEITLRFVGSENINSKTLTGMWLCQTFTRNWRTLGMCSMAHAAKVSNVMGGMGRGVFGAIVLSLFVGFITAFLYTLYLGYDIGASNFIRGGFQAGAIGYWSQLETFLMNPSAVTASQLIMVLNGMVIAGLLIWAHHRFHFWPLHPVGFGIVTTYAADMAFFSIMIVWFAKSIVLKLGGVPLYRKGQPLVIGILVGYVLGVFLTFIFDVR